jgi:hypothetical protein
MMTNDYRTKRLLDAACQLALTKLAPVKLTVNVVENKTSKEEVHTLQNVLDEVREEVASAEAKWPAMNSAHEAYGVLMEEIRELEEHVFTNQKRRNMAEMRAEAIQVAAMAVRLVRDICDGNRGHK